MVTETSTAPWTEDQVRNLERRQAAVWLHPYTCNGCSPSRDLRPTSDGLVCDGCGYHQNWAHAVDVVGDFPSNPFPSFYS
jgi:hypothetical protein